MTSAIIVDLSTKRIKKELPRNELVICCCSCSRVCIILGKISELEFHVSFGLKSLILPQKFMLHLHKKDKNPANSRKRERKCAPQECQWWWKKKKMLFFSRICDEQSEHSFSLFVQRQSRFVILFFSFRSSNKLFSLFYHLSNSHTFQNTEWKQKCKEKKPESLSWSTFMFSYTPMTNNHLR